MCIFFKVMNYATWNKDIVLVLQVKGTFLKIYFWFEFLICKNVWNKRDNMNR